MADNEKVSVWEFVSIVKAAVYATYVDSNYDDRDEFVEQAWECYQVVERRIRDSETSEPFGLPDMGKEDAVKQLAGDHYGSDLDSDIQMKALYCAIPSPSSADRLQSIYDKYHENIDYDPYT